MLKSRRVIWSGSARKHLKAIYRHIAKFSPTAADGFVTEPYEKMRELADLDLTGADADADDLKPGLRRFVHQRRC